MGCATDSDGATATHGWIEKEIEGEGDGEVLRAGEGEEGCSGGEGDDVALLGHGRGGGHTVPNGGGAASDTAIKDAGTTGGGGGGVEVERWKKAIDATTAEAALCACG